MKKEDRIKHGKKLKSRLGYNEYMLDAYGPDKNKQTKPPVDIRVGFNERTETMVGDTTIQVEKMSQNLYNEIIKDNMRLKEENDYLKSLIDDIRNEY